MRRALRALARLSPRQRRVAARCAVVALAVEVSLRTSPLPRTAARFGSRLSLERRPAATGDPGQHLTARELEDLAVARRVLTVGPFNGTCLRQALVQGHVLRRRRPLLRIGVTKLDGTVTAHAWLEVAGTNLDPSGASRFEPLGSPGEPRSPRGAPPAEGRDAGPTADAVPSATPVASTEPASSDG